MKLDKSKPFGVVFGISDAAFEQDGVLFDCDGESIGDEVAKSKGGRPKKEVPVEPSTPAADPELDAQIKAASEA